MRVYTHNVFLNGSAFRDTLAANGHQLAAFGGPLFMCNAHGKSNRDQILGSQHINYDGYFLCQVHNSSFESTISNKQKELALSIYNRLGPAFNSLYSCFERTHLREIPLHNRAYVIYKGILSALHLISSLEIEYIVFGYVPNAVSDILLWRTASEIGIPSFTSYWFPSFSEYSFIVDSRLRPVIFNDQYNSLRSRESANYLERYLSSGKIADPSLLVDDPNNHIYRDGLKSGSNVSQIDEDHVVFFLNYDPETITMVMSPPFYDQLAYLQQLRHKLPDHIKIIIKEHPFYEQIKRGDNVSFSPEVVSRYRSEYFYNNIKSLPNSVYISSLTPAKYFLTNPRCRFCVTSGSSVIFEALSLLVPIVTFAHAPVCNHPLLFRGITHANVNGALVKRSESSQYPLLPAIKNMMPGRFYFEDYEFEKLEPDYFLANDVSIAESISSLIQIMSPNHAFAFNHAF